MLTDSIPETLSQCTEDALASMFFTPILGLHDAAGKQPYLRVRICFLGGAAQAGHSDTAAPGGHLDLEASRDAANSIAANFLAADDRAVPDHRVDDVLCELANIICGSVMSAIASKEGFSLLSPEIIRGEAEWPHSIRFEGSYELERGWLRVRLALTNT